MVERRVVFSLGLTYETPRDTLRRIPGVVRAIVGEQDRARFDRCHFASYGPYSLDFETVYFVLDPDYHRYMDVQQSINLRIHEEFDKLGAEFAFPTQTLRVARQS
jgi:small-conductance mechanosensitive channel